VHVAAFTVAYSRGHARTSLEHLFLGTERGATGTALLATFAVMWIFSLGVIRRSQRFELFYVSHFLYVAWIALIIAHAPSFLVGAAIPLVAFGVEQALRLARRGKGTKIIATEALRSGVTRLELEKPPQFEYDPADYLFLRIPEIAVGEWHPFTISSAPEHHTLTVHVRSLGNWTSALRRLAEDRETNRRTDALTAYVDGPYGSPSAHIFQAKHAVLIGAGIGVTPFASVLESLVRRASGQGHSSKLERAHFFWLNRDQYSFEWFRELLAELEKVDTGALLDIHLCMTGARTGATALGLELAREVLHASGRSDLITGLRTHTHLGHPDFEHLLGELKRRHAPDVIEVFFCGPPGLARKLRRTCENLQMPFREEQF
jgi:predicted ferric reductase